MRVLARISRGVGALILLSALVAGTPLLLLRIGRLPTVSPFPEVLFSPDQGALLLGVLTIVAWLAWGAFAVSVTTELVVLGSRRRIRVRLPGLTAPRGLAAGLFLTIAAMVPMTAHAQPLAPTPVEAPQPPAAETGLQSLDRIDTDPALRYIVQRGDDLWSLAEQFYGDGRAWQRIVAANPIITNPDEIDVGWELVLPGIDPLGADAADSSTAPPTEDPRHGDQRQDDWQRDDRGHGDSAQGDREQGDREQGDREQGAREASPDAPVAEHATPPARVPEVVPGQTPAVADQDPEAGAAAALAPPVDRIAYATAGVSSLIAAGLIAMLAVRRTSQLTGREPGRRIVQPTTAHQHFEAALGQAQDPLTLRAVDLALRALGRHYRDARMKLPELGEVLVADDRICFEVDRIPRQLPPDFHADSRRMWIGVAEGERLALQADDLLSDPAPYPALVCLGETTNGALLLHDLETIGVLGLSGAPEVVRGVLDSLTLELSSSWWGRGQAVVLVGGDAALVKAIDSPCLEVRPHLDAVLDELEAEALQRQPERAGDHPRDLRLQADLTEAWRPRVLLVGTALTNRQRERATALARAADIVVVAADPHFPSASVMEPPAQSTLPSGRAYRALVLSSEARANLTGVLRATADFGDTPAPWWNDGHLEAVPPPTPHFPAAPNAAAPDPSRPDSAGLDSDSGELNRFDAGLSALVGPASTRPEPAPRTNVVSLAARRAAFTPEEPAAMDAHEPVLHSDAEHPTVLLLGPVDLVGARGVQPNRAVRQCIEYAAWLLEHPGATSSMMATALFVAESTRRSNMSRLRSWLGADSEGKLYLPDAYSGRIQLHPGVTSDWNRVQLLTIGGVNRAADTNLIAALELVRGAPLADAAPGQWHWAEELRTDMSSVIRDVGLVLAERAMERGELDLARWATNRALVAAAEDERLLAARVRVEHRVGNRSEVERLALRLVRSARALNVDLADETVTLLQEVMEGQPRSRTIS